MSALTKRTVMNLLFLLIVAEFIVLGESPANAYIGPGVGISAVGTVFAFIGAVFLAIVGFIWYPLKRLLATLRRKAPRRQES